MTGYSSTLHSSKRHCSHVSFKGKYVSSNLNGIVTIKQNKYPIYSGVQNLRLEPKIISELMTYEGNGMPYHLVDTHDLQGPFEGTSRMNQ